MRPFRTKLKKLDRIVANALRPFGLGGAGMSARPGRQRPGVLRELAAAPGRDVLPVPAALVVALLPAPAA